jgi:hypothetical protein
MTPLEVVKQAEGMKLQDQKGKITELKLLPALSDVELRELESQLPCPLPTEARELFLYCRGLEGSFKDTVAEVSFFQSEGFGLEEVFPHAFPVARDWAGNYWIADLVSDSSSWGPIFYACHDAPVIIFQTDSLAHFLSELLRLGNQPWQSEIEYVHDDGGDIWLNNPGMITHEQCLTSGDPDLEAFARSVDETWLFKDLREPRLGDGFSWGRYGPQTVVRRYRETRVFAYQQRKSLWQRLLGR